MSDVTIMAGNQPMSIMMNIIASDLSTCPYVIVGANTRPTAAINSHVKINVAIAANMIFVDSMTLILWLRKCFTPKTLIIHTMPSI